MKPVETADTPIDRRVMINYLTSLQNSKVYLLGSDASANSQIGMLYDTGGLAMLTDLKYKLETYQDLNDFMPEAENQDDPIDEDE